MAKIVNEVGLSRTQKYPNYSVTMSWDRDCCVYRTVIKRYIGKVFAPIYPMTCDMPWPSLLVYHIVASTMPMPSTMPKYESCVA